MSEIQDDSSTSADLIVSYLEKIGVEYVFGVPGGAIEPMYNALARSDRRGGPKAIVARHEAGAAFMADGYARETGKIGVCIATSGPGATNLITGVACAYANGVPMLVITGQPPLRSFGKNALQESSCTGINIVSMMSNCARYSSLVSHVDQLESKLCSALMQAYSGPGGPTHLSIPVDIQRSSVRISNRDFSELLYPAPHLIPEWVAARLFAELQQAQSVVFLIGDRCIGAIDAIMELVHITGALFVSTPDGKGLIDPHHPTYRGVFGFGGHASADALLQGNPDLILAFGTDFGEFSSSSWSESILNNRLIHIDACGENLMRSPMARMHVYGHIRSVCDRVIELMQANSYQINLLHTGMADDIQHTLYDTTPIKPQRLMQVLSEKCPQSTRFVADAGNSATWAIHCLRPHSQCGNWLRVTMNFAPMGWAIGAAVGIASGGAQCPVVCITGDGSYLMSGQEITVAASQGLTVLFIVLNDGVLGMVKHGQRIARAEAIGFELPQVDYCLLAQAMGIPGHVIRSPQDLDALDFDTIFSRKGPTMLDVRIDGEEVPPMNVRMRTLKTGE